MKDVNTLEAKQKVVENLLIDLEQNYDCSEWECEECPFFLTEIVEDPRYRRHTCGWFLLKSTASKILRK